MDKLSPVSILEVKELISIPGVSRVPRVSGVFGTLSQFMFSVSSGILYLLIRQVPLVLSLAQHVFKSLVIVLLRLVVLAAMLFLPLARSSSRMFMVVVWVLVVEVQIVIDLLSTSLVARILRLVHSSFEVSTLHVMVALVTRMPLMALPCVIVLVDDSQRLFTFASGS